MEISQKLLNKYIGRRFGIYEIVNFSHKSKKLTYWNCICIKCKKEFIFGVTSFYKPANTCIKHQDEKDLIVNVQYKRYLDSAKQRNKKFSLTKKDFKTLIFENCYYCNIKPKTIKSYNTKIFVAHGIDRIDSKIGYELKNVVPCCKICNYAKNDLTKEEFEEWIDTMVNYRLTSKPERYLIDSSLYESENFQELS